MTIIKQVVSWRAFCFAAIAAATIIVQMIQKITWGQNDYNNLYTNARVCKVSRALVNARILLKSFQSKSTAAVRNFGMR